jgi:hypothetical protein
MTYHRRPFFSFKSDGVTRFVVLIGPIAIKIARFVFFRRIQIDNGLTGMLGNRREHRFGRKGTSFIGLCPSFWCSPLGLFQIMRRADPISSEEWQRLRGGKARLIYKNMSGMIERKQSSFGLIDGELVAVDYAG